jgi:ribonuclease HI
MKQLELFDAPSDSLKKNNESHHWKLFVDGAARNNPGPAGAGIYILQDEQFFFEYGYYLGKKTNNQAEYLALLLGLYALKNKVQTGDKVHIISDSLLLVQQIRGVYKVRNAELKPLHSLAVQWVHEIKADVFHVLRFDNVNADNMANVGIDKKNNVPPQFITILKQHGISII